MLELGGGELPGGFGGMIAADPGLRVPLQLVQGDIDRFTVCLAHPVITANKRGQRNRLGRGKRGVPTCPMFHRRDRLTLFGFVPLDHTMKD